jgi:ubiquitin-activating enzyme E1
LVNESKTPFWEGQRLPPTPLEFDVNDILHMEFIKYTSYLRAEIFNIKIPKSNFDFKKVIEKFKVEKFVPKEAKIQKKEREKDFNKKIEKFKKKLPKKSEFEGFRVNQINFEKDNPKNFHIDFINSTSNLRARNYKIKQVDKNETRLIAGKIIPAMITTTSLITGLATFEMYKVKYYF